MMSTCRQGQLEAQASSKNWKRYLPETMLPGESTATHVILGNGVLVPLPSVAHRPQKKYLCIDTNLNLCFWRSSARPWPTVCSIFGLYAGYFSRSISYCCAAFCACSSMFSTLGIAL